MSELRVPADLEIGLHHRDAGLYTVELRSDWPESDVDPLSGEGRPAQFDFGQLLQLRLDPTEYGRVLARSLFADPALLADFTTARGVMDSRETPLRVRLLIGASAPELHRLYWETLCDPRDGSPLFHGDNLHFSRYLLGSAEWRPVRPRSRGELRALVVIANPSDLAKYDLAEIKADDELTRARAGLGAIPVAALPDPDTGERATLDNLIARLRRDSYDIVYLVCHGKFDKNDTAWLWLENDKGLTARVSGDEAAGQLKSLAQRPLLIVLASCESAGKDEGDVLSALGPRLAGAGVPAVLAMQGQITMPTVDKFMPVFFESLREDGHIDQAVALARNAVRDRPDYWMPVLFMRLKSGRVWYRPGFASRDEEFEKWPSLLNSLQRGKCTPIVGPGLVEPLLGSSREIAQLWAEAFEYPMAPYERESLPQVAQYVATKQDPAFIRDKLSEYSRDEIQRRHNHDLPPELRNGAASLDQLIEAVWSKRWERDLVEPYRVLAQLQLPVYITANWNNLLAKAIHAVGNEPEVVVSPWNQDVEMIESVFDREPDYVPSSKRPLVYHLLGRLDNPSSMVLTEDDYFDFLMGVTSNKKLIPPLVRSALTNTALLFLGFQMDDWNFRVLLRIIIGQQGGSRRHLYTHVAAQIEPEEDRILEPRRARKYLEQYFEKGADISIYWGSPDDFLKEMWRRQQEAAREAGGS